MGEDIGALLCVKNLSISFDGREVLRSVNFRIAAGQIFALTGPSGSGKSLTALSIARLQPPTAQLSGTITFDGKEMQKLDERERCRLLGGDISYIFQEPMACFNPSIPIGKQVVECLAIHSEGLTKKEMGRRVLRWFWRLQIPDPERTYGSYAHELSGGMLQRAMVAMALVNGPRLLIADEPTSALDAKSCRVAIGQLLNLQRQLGFAVLFITHDTALAENIAHRIGRLDGGKIASIAEPNRRHGGTWP